MALIQVSKLPDRIYCQTKCGQRLRSFVIDYGWYLAHFTNPGLRDPKVKLSEALVQHSAFQFQLEEIGQMLNIYEKAFTGMDIIEYLRQMLPEWQIEPVYNDKP